MYGVKRRRFIVLFIFYITFDPLVCENARMINSLPTKRISAISQWKTFIRVLPTRWRRKSAGNDITSLSPYEWPTCVCLRRQFQPITWEASSLLFWVRGEAWRAESDVRFLGRGQSGTLYQVQTSIGIKESFWGWNEGDALGLVAFVHNLHEVVELFAIGDCWF